MPYNTKTTVTFSFELPINLDSKAQAESRIKDLISSGNIKLQLPDGFKNLELDDCKISVTGFNADSINSVGGDFGGDVENGFNSDSDDNYTKELLAAYKDLDNRILNANNR